MATKKTIIRIARDSEVEMDRASSLLFLNRCQHLTGQLWQVRYYRDSTKTSIDTIIAIGIKNGIGSNSYRVISKGIETPINGITSTIPDVSTLIHGEIYLADINDKWCYITAVDGTLYINEISGGPYSYWNLEDNHIWYYNDGFLRRDDDFYTRKEIDDISLEVDDIEKRTQIASSFNEILTPEFWTTSDGILHVVPGIVVSISGDSDSIDGLWYLSNSDYQNPESWIKLILLKEGEEIIPGDWEFTGNTKISGGLNISSNDAVITKGTTINLGDDGKSLEVDLEGKSNLNVDKIIADESEIGDLEEKIENLIGRVGIGNLLRNTSFLGEFESETFKKTEIVTEDTHVFSNPISSWDGYEYEIIDRSQSISGKSVKFLSEDSFLQQVPVGSLTPGESYTISWKQKGTTTVQFNGNTWTETTSDYEIVWKRFEYTAETFTSNVRFSGINSEICEIKLEWGVVPTSWFPSLADTDPVALRFLEYDFIKTALTEKSEFGGIPGTIKLETMLQVSDSESNVKGGLSGVYTSDKDLLFWSGGTYKESKELLKKVKNDPNYWNKSSDFGGEKNPRAVIPYRDLAVFSWVNALGFFTGDFFGNFYDNRDKTERLKNYRISGTIPYLDTQEDLTIQAQNLPTEGVLVFRDGLFVETSLEPGDPDVSVEVISEYDESEPSEDMPHTSLSFENGRLTDVTGRLVVKVYTGNQYGELSRFQDNETFFIYLTFIDKYLVSISKEKPDTYYYWY